MPKRLITLIAVIGSFWLLHAPTVSGAPFCVKGEGTPAECWYYDIRSCMDEANRRQGHCAANPNEMKMTANGSPFCLIDSSLIPVCSFRNSDTCTDAIGERNAVCYENTALKELRNTSLAASDPESDYLQNEMSPFEMLPSIDLTDPFGMSDTHKYYDELDPFQGSLTSYR